MTYVVSSAKTPNRSSRVGVPLYLVIHRMQGTLDGSVAWFANRESEVSADECISRDGKRVVVLNTPGTGLKCWAVGNANSLSFSFEIEGSVGDEGMLPDTLFETLADRLKAAQAAINTKYKTVIPLKLSTKKGEAGIVGHHQLAVWYGGSDHTCPGDFPFGRLVSALEDHAKPDPPPLRECYVLGAGGPPAIVVDAAWRGDDRGKALVERAEWINLANKHGRVVLDLQERRKLPERGKPIS